MLTKPCINNFYTIFVWICNIFYLKPSLMNLEGIKMISETFNFFQKSMAQANCDE